MGKTAGIPGVLKANTERAMALSEDDLQAIPANVWLPPAIHGRPFQVVSMLEPGRAPSVQENIVRIQENADPIGFLVAVAMGQPVACFEVDEQGKVTVHYETADLQTRIKVNRHLADKVLPRMSLALKKSLPHDDEPDRVRSRAVIERAAGQADGE